jgi:hypothetical protein
MLVSEGICLNHELLNRCLVRWLEESWDVDVDVDGRKTHVLP